MGCDDGARQAGRRGNDVPATTGTAVATTAIALCFVLLARSLALSLSLVAAQTPTTTLFPRCRSRLSLFHSPTPHLSISFTHIGFFTLVSFFYSSMLLLLNLVSLIFVSFTQFGFIYYLFISLLTKIF
jgi:hypothetical protein